MGLNLMNFIVVANSAGRKNYNSLCVLQQYDTIITEYLRLWYMSPLRINLPGCRLVQHRFLCFIPLRAATIIIACGMSYRFFLYNIAKSFICVKIISFISLIMKKICVSSFQILMSHDMW